MKPFRKTWTSFGIDVVRPNAPFATYSDFDYSMLPPIPDVKLDGSLDWLREEGHVDAKYQEEYGRDTPEETWSDAIARLEKQAGALGLSIPEAYLTLISDYDLRKRLRSPTASFLTIPDEITEIADRENEFLMTIYQDSQSCFYWFLFWDRDRNVRVVGSEYNFPRYRTVEKINDAYFGSPDGLTTSWDGIWEQEGDFETFLFRLWVESEIWYRYEFDECENEDDWPELTPLQVAYRDAYLAVEPADQ